MDYHGVPGRRVGTGHAEAGAAGGDIYSHHNEGGDEGARLSPLSEQATQRRQRSVGLRVESGDFQI